MKKEIAAIYCRLSVEDAEKRAAESESIRNQRALLLGYAKKQGWAVYDIYADEDYSGLREDRPAFQRLLADAEERKFSIILCKTQSRFTRNAGTAEKTVPVELILPADVTLSGDLPEGFTRSQRQIRGEVKAAAAAGDEPFTTTLVFPMTVNEDALDGDEDAMRLLTGALRVDGKRVALPRVQLCGAKISARLLPQTDSLKAGETMALRVVLVNSGLAGADVRVSCVLPEGLSLVKAEETETEPEEATGSEAESALPPETDDGRGADAEPVLADEETLAEPEIRQENGAAVFFLHIDAAGEDAATRVVTLHVRADEPQENIKERLLGATLAWQTDAGETQLGEAACVRVYQPMVFGLTKDEWMGILWAGLLLVVTVSCLFAAFNSENKREKYCE